MGDINNVILFFTVLKVSSPRSRCQQVQFLLKPISLACRCLPSLCILTWLFFCMHVYVLISYKGHQSYQIRAHHITSVTYLCVLSPIKYQRLGLQHEFWRHTIQLITLLHIGFINFNLYQVYILKGNKNKYLNYFKIRIIESLFFQSFVWKFNYLC